MKTPIILLLALVLVCLVGMFILNYNIDNTQQPTTNKYYQGPIPEGYDEQYFRETGITRLEVKG